MSARWSTLPDLAESTVDHEGAARPPEAPGKRTLTSSLPASADAIAGRVARLLRRADASAEPSVAPEAAVDRAAGSSGAPLPEPVRERFEASLGADLSAVRVHTGAESAAAAQAVGAQAYATGNDIHFAAGKYQPDDPFGLHLLAHEVAHTQQQSGSAPSLQFKLDVPSPGDPAEVEADKAADEMVHGDKTAQELDDDLRFQADVHEGERMRSDQVVFLNSRSTVTDATAAGDLITRIEGGGDLLARACGAIAAETGTAPTGRVGDAPATTNAQTVFHLREYMFNVQDSGISLEKFQAAYSAVQATHGRLDGMAEAIGAGKPDSTAEGTWRDGAESLGDLRSEMNDLLQNNAFQSHWGAYEKRREQLSTVKDNIIEQQGIVNTSAKDVLGNLYALQSEAAGAQAKEKESSLSALRAEINAAVSNIMSVISVAGGITAAVALPAGMKLADIASASEDYMKKHEHHDPGPNGPKIEPPKAPPPAAGQPSWLEPTRHSPSATTPSTPQAPTHNAPAENYSAGAKARGMVGKYAGEITNVDAHASALAGKAGIDLKGLDISAKGGAEALVKKLIERAEAAKLTKLESAINALKATEALSKLKAEALKTAAKEDQLRQGIKKVATFLDDFTKNKSELAREEKALVGLAMSLAGGASGPAGGKGSKVTTALRLLTQIDVFSAEVGLAKSFGEEVRDKAKTALAKREQISTNRAASQTMSGKDAQQLSWYGATALEDPGAKSARESSTKANKPRASLIYRITHNDVSLGGHNAGSLAGPWLAGQSGEDQGVHATVLSVLESLDRYDEWAQSVRTTLANALGASLPPALHARTAR